MPRTPDQRHTPHSSFRAVARKAADRAAADAGRRLAKRLALLIPVALICSMCAARVMEERLVLSPPPVAPSAGDGATHVAYAASDGQRLFGYAIEPADSSARASGVVLVFHGHDETANDWIAWGRQVAQRTGRSVFIAEYRGYGGLAGVPTFEGSALDARAAYAAAAARYDAEPGDVVIYARGFGSGVALQVAAARRVRTVALEAPMASLRSFEGRVIPWPMSWMVQLASSNAHKPRDVVRLVTAPVWVVAGGRDRRVPERTARSLHEAARTRGEFLTVTSAAHHDIAEQGGAEYWAWLDRALGSGQRTADGARATGADTAHAADCGVDSLARRAPTVQIRGRRVCQSVLT